MGFVTDVLLPLALAFIMFSLGLGLTVSDFARVARQPKDFSSVQFPRSFCYPWSGSYL